MTATSASAPRLLTPLTRSIHLQVASYRPGASENASHRAPRVSSAIVRFEKFQNERNGNSVRPRKAAASRPNRFSKSGSICPHMHRSCDWFGPSFEGPEGRPFRRRPTRCAGPNLTWRRSDASAGRCWTIRCSRRRLLVKPLRTALPESYVDPPMRYALSLQLTT